MPEMPELPDEYAANVPQEKLHLGTHHQTETELQKMPSASEQFVEEGVTKYALHDGSVEKESPAIGTDATDDDDVSRGDEVEVVSETAVPVEQESDLRHHEAVQETQKTAVPEPDDQQDVASRTSSERKIPPVLMVGPATPPAASGKEESAFASDSTSAKNQGVTENNEENTAAGANAPAAYANDAYDNNKNLHIDPVGDGVVESAQVSPGDYPTDIYGYYADDGSKNGSDADLGETADDSIIEVPPPPESSGSGTGTGSGSADAAAQVLETSGPAPGVAPSGELQAESTKVKDGSAEQDVDPAVLAAAVPGTTGNSASLTSGDASSDQHEQHHEARDQLQDEPSQSQDDHQRTPVLGSGGLSSGTVPMRRMSSSGHHALYPTDSVHSYGGEDETDSTASLSTGRRSLDSSADQRSMRTSMDVPSHMRSKQGSLRQPLHEYDEDNLPPVVDDHEVYSPPAAASPSVSGGRWKPLATELPPAPTGGAGGDDSPADSPTTNQDKLEREIMGTFRPPAGAAAAGVAAGSAVGAGAAVVARHHAKQPSIEVDEYNEPDPEIAALYQNTSSFLSRPLSGYDYDNMAPIEPLATNRSGQSAVSSERAFASETERGSDPAAHSPAVGGEDVGSGGAADSSSSSSSSSSGPSPSVSPEPNQSLEAVSGAQVGAESAAPRAEDDEDAPPLPRRRDTDLDAEEQAPAMPPRRKSSLDQFDDFDSDFTRERAGSASSADSDGSANAAGVAAGAAGAAVAAGTAGAIAASGSRDSDERTPTPVRKDSADTTGEPLNRVQTSSSTTAAAPSSGVGAKVKRPPTFDFMGVLTKGRSEDRRAAFEDARAKEYEYRFYRHGANLETWLETISTFHSGAGVYTAGRPPPATQQELKRAAPSRTMSSHFRPAKNVTKEALGTLGEKSARKAKGFFSRGKSLLKS